MELNTLLMELAERSGSDLHLVAGQPPVFRIDGALVRREGDALAEEVLNALLLAPLSEEQKTRLMSHRQDVAISLRREGRSYRYYLYRERGRLAGAFGPCRRTRRLWSCSILMSTAFAAHWKP